MSDDSCLLLEAHPLRGRGTVLGRAELSSLSLYKSVILLQDSNFGYVFSSHLNALVFLISAKVNRKVS